MFKLPASNNTQKERTEALTNLYTDNDEQNTNNFNLCTDRSEKKKWVEHNVFLYLPSRRSSYPEQTW
jgi:hypothetical protein